MPNNIVKGKIGNALESVAPDHILGVAQDIFDEELQMYQSEINSSSGSYDISVNHLVEGEPTKYSDLAAALGDDGANVPENVRKGGMIIKFVQSSDNKYVQYRLTSDTFTTTISEWQEQGENSRYSNLYKQANIDKNNKIFHAIDASDNEHHYLPQVFHNSLMMDNPNLTNIGNTKIETTPFYKQANIDKNNKIFHAIDASDNEHHYLPQVFHGQVTFEYEPIVPAESRRLNILVIGNSFTSDMLAYISDMIQASSVYDGISIYHISVSGGYLELYSNIIDANDAIKNHSYGGNTVQLRHIFGSNLSITSDNTLLEIFSQNWDVLTLCQVSSGALNYETYNPYLCKILTSFKQYCLNKSCKISWLTSWSRGNKDTIPTEIKMLTGWQNMMAAVKQLDADFGRVIDVYIPASTAIQNARNTNLNPIGDFTRDWHHVAHGYGIWLVDACFYQKIIAPYNGVPIWDFNYYKTIEQSIIDDWYNEYGTICGSVTEQNIDTLRKCVMYACVNQFKII